MIEGSTAYCVAGVYCIDICVFSGAESNDTFIRDNIECRSHRQTFFFSDLNTL